MAEPSILRRAARAALTALADSPSPRIDAAPAPPVAMRADGLVETVAGIGNPNYDRSAAGNRAIVTPAVLSFQQLEALYENPIAGRLVDVPPRECTRRGWSIYADTADTDEGSEPFANECQRLGLREALRQRDQWARLYGGAAIVLDVEDGRDPEEPLDIENVSELRGLRVVDMHELVVASYYRGDEYTGGGVVEPTPPGMMGEPRTYRLTPHNAMQGAGQLVHCSRVLVQVGREVPRRRRAEFYWYGASVLQRAVDALLDLVVADRGLANIIEDFRTTIMRIKGLSTMATSKEGTNNLLSRMQAINLGKSIVRMVMLDAEEDMMQQGAPVSGLADLYGKVQQAVAAASDGMPLDLLFGIAPQGLSSSNESGRDHWHDVIAGRQASIYEPAILRVCELLRASGAVDVPEDAELRVVFHQLRTPSEKEQAETREIQSRTDERYMKWNVLHPAEVRAGRFTGLGWSSDTRLLEANERDAVSLLNDEPAVPPPGE